MSAFASPGLIWLVVPCLALWWLFGRVQRRALNWLEAHVSPRFRRHISVYRPLSLRLHLGLLLLMALALVVAAAGPFRRGRAETVMASGRLLFLIDGSASMWAEDVQRPADDTEAVISEGRKYKRSDFARHIALSLMRELEGFRFALGSFSGTGVVHLPMTDDLALIERALATLELHSYYRNTGSSFSGALDLVPHFVDRRGFRLQVVLLSDGEQPLEEDYGPALAALAGQDVPVHSVAIGSLEGQSRRILNFQDVVDKKESPRVLRVYHTRRVDEHLKRISRKTGGSFFVAEEGVAERLSKEILSAGAEAEPFEHQAARTDLSGLYLAVFLAGLLFDTLWFGRRPRQLQPAFRLDRLGEPSGEWRHAPGSAPARSSGALVCVIGPVLVAGLFLGCTLPFVSDGGGRRQAHRENERGIAKDALRNHRGARPHYERSRGYEIEPQIPLHNLARSVLLSEDYSEAHELFQEALLVAPNLPEAHFNDGMTLYVWGVAERDPRNCDLERTRELWGQAQRRFSSARAAARAAGSDELGNRVRANRAALAEELEEVERLIADPPEECFSESPQSSASGGGGGGGGSGGGAGGGGAKGGEGEGDGEGENGSEEQEGEDAGGEGDGEEDESEGAGDGEPQEGESESGAGGDPQESPASARDPGEEDSEDGGGEGSGGGGGGDLTESELEEIRQQLELLAQQGREPGKYHRRTLPEQFRKGDWSNPDATIWW